MPYMRDVAPVCRQMVTLLVEYECSMVPIGGSDFYGQQHLGVEISDCRIVDVNGFPLLKGITYKQQRNHRIVAEFFLWEEHANEIAQRVIEQHLRSQE